MTAAPHAILQTIGPGDVVFDIGANRGDKALWFIERGARVVCVEPQPRLVEVLNQRFGGDPNVTVVPKGLAAAPGVADMAICSAHQELSTFAPHWQQGRCAAERWDQTATVELTTLDHLVGAFGSPKYCKIDVEGYELEVVNGLSSKIGCLSFEFTGEFIGMSMKVVERLIRLGYDSFNVSAGESEKFYFENWLPFYDLVHILMNSARQNRELWGDIYAR